MLGHDVPDLERLNQFVIGKKEQRVTEAVQALKTKTCGQLRIAGDGGLLFQLRGARVLVDLSIDVFAAQKALDRAVVATRMAGLVAGVERIVNISRYPKGFPPDRL